MDKQEIIDYVMDSPSNTNPAILGQMIDEVSGSGSGDEITERTLVFEGTVSDLYDLHEFTVENYDSNKIKNINALISLFNNPNYQIIVTIESNEETITQRLICESITVYKISIASISYTDNNNNMFFIDYDFFKNVYDIGYGTISSDDTDSINIYIYIEPKPSKNEVYYVQFNLYDENGTLTLLRDYIVLKGQTIEITDHGILNRKTFDDITDMENIIQNVVTLDSTHNTYTPTKNIRLGYFNGGK